MSQPPRRIERIIESLGVDKSVCDAVVGDLAEEFASRVQRDGERAARRWYYREAARSIPPLLRRWVRNARFRDFTRLIGIVMSSLIFASVFAGIVSNVVYSVANAFHRYPRALDQNSPALVIIGLGLGLSMLGGHIAAFLDRRAPVIAALGFGILLATLQLIEFLHNGRIWNHTPLSLRMVLPALIIVGAFAGGILKAATQRDDPQVAE